MTKTKYNNLKDKTIFDFTDDPNIIGEIVAGTREEYLSGLTIDARYNGFLELADLTNNKDLADEALKQLAPFCMGYTGLE